MSPVIYPVPEIPQETYLATRQVFNIQHIYLRIGDQLGEILDEIDLAHLDPTSLLTRDAICRLVLATNFQYAETLHDSAASEATLKRMDWKYAMHLPIKHPGITAAALCEFRQNLCLVPKGMDDFDTIFKRLASIGLFHEPSTSASHVVEMLSCVCSITRFYKLNQSMKNALSFLVAVEPDWLRANALPHWYVRYKTGGLGQSTYNRSEMIEKAATIGADITQLLSSLQASHRMQHIMRAPEIAMLFHVLEEEYIMDAGSIRWRLPACASCTCHHQN